MQDNSEHEGVGLIIRSNDASLWFVQQKDETYPIEKWRLSYSLWGGAMEVGESPEVALLRELKEELDWVPETMPISIGRKLVQSDRIFPIHLFEYLMPKENLKTWVQGLEVQEGYGKLVVKEALFEQSWVWDLDQLMKDHDRALFDY
jgi:ADP-ribose pyrophosphatase YjhB (NUDIX family)